MSEHSDLSLTQYSFGGSVETSESGEIQQGEETHVNHKTQRDNDVIADTYLNLLLSHSKTVALHCFREITASDTSSPRLVVLLLPRNRDGSPQPSALLGTGKGW